MVEWLERISYVAESRRRSLVPTRASPSDYWKTLYVIPAVNGTISDQGRIRKDWLRLYMLCLRYVGLYPLCPLWLLDFGKCLPLCFPKRCHSKGKQCRPSSDCFLEQSDLGLHYLGSKLRLLTVIICSLHTHVSIELHY